MRYLRMLGLGSLFALLLAACGSNAGASKEPGTSSEPSAEPSAAASQDGNGNGGVGLGDGSVKFELTGAATRSGEFGYLKGLGMIDASGNQIALTFVDAANTASVTINSGPSGSVVLYADQDIGAILAPVGTVIGECSVDVTELTAGSAKGTFRCEHVAVIQSGQTVLGEGTMTGTFSAHN